MRLIVGKCLLREILKKRGLSQTDLAVALNVKPQQINSYVSNKRIMSYPVAINICAILNCKMEDLYEVIQPEEDRER